MAYTYCITFIPSGQRYYGVRYAANSNPSDLWIDYFTSSKYIHRLIENYGISAFNYEVRKIFNCPKKAVEWEHKVLKRIKAIERPEWLNRGLSKSVNTGGFLRSSPKQIAKKYKLSNPDYYKKSKENCMKLSKRNTQSIWVNNIIKEKFIPKINLPYYLTKGYIEGRIQVSQNFINYCKNRTGNKNPAWGITRKDLSDRNKLSKRWVTNGVIDKLILIEKEKEYLNNGFWIGRSKASSEEARKKISQARANKEYIIKNPEGNTFIFTNLTLFCKNHNIISSSLEKAFKENRLCSKGKTKGWKIISKTPLNIT